MTRKTSLDRFVKKAVSLGAFDAKIIPADSVVTAAWVRIKGCAYKMMLNFREHPMSRASRNRDPFPELAPTFACKD